MTDYYTNLYRDEKGTLCWSENFYDMYTNIQQAWAEAARYQGIHGWEYIATVGTGLGGTNKKDVDDIAEALGYGIIHHTLAVPDKDASWDELCDFVDSLGDMKWKE